MIRQIGFFLTDRSESKPKFEESIKIFERIGLKEHINRNIAVKNGCYMHFCDAYTDEGLFNYWFINCNDEQLAILILSGAKK